MDDGVIPSLRDILLCVLGGVISTVGVVLILLL